MNTSLPLKIDTKLIDSFRTDLQTSGWTQTYLDDLFADFGSSQVTAENIALMRHVAARNPIDSAAIFTRLFLLGDKLSDKTLAIAFDETGVKGAEKLGLIRAVNDQKTRWRAAVQVKPHTARISVLPEDGEEVSDGGIEPRVYHWWIASDLPEVVTGEPVAPEHVLGVGGATNSLLRFTVRKPRVESWDLGTGCGIQALYLAVHSAKVLATDISERCLNFARFNAALAGKRFTQKIEFVRGSFLEPAEGRDFDLIVSNPPFVITPRSFREDVGLMEYRDGGRAGDGVVAYLCAELPRYLRAGGVLQMLANWEIQGDDWQERPERWFTGHQDLDTWITLRERQTPVQYASLWLRDGGLDARMQRREFQVGMQNWVGDFESRQVDSIGFGYICARKHEERREAQRWYQDAEGTGLAADGLFAAKILHNQGLISTRESVGEKAYFQGKWLLSESVAEQRFYQPGEEDPQLIRLVQGEGWGVHIDVDPMLAGLVGACDGELTVEQIIAAIAQLAAIPIESVEQSCQEFVELVQTGMVMGIED